MDDHQAPECVFDKAEQAEELRGRQQNGLIGNEEAEQQQREDRVRAAEVPLAPTRSR